MTAFDTAVELAKELVVSQRVRDVRSTTEQEYTIPGQRLKLTSPGAGRTFKNAVHITRRSRLTGITLFIDAPDAGDTATFYLGGRVVVDALRMDLVANTTFDIGLSEEARAGDLLEAAYFSGGSSTKNFTWTAKAVLL